MFSTTEYETAINSLRDQLLLSLGEDGISQVYALEITSLRNFLAFKFVGKHNFIAEISERFTAQPVFSFDEFALGNVKQISLKVLDKRAAMLPINMKSGVQWKVLIQISDEWLSLCTQTTGYLGQTIRFLQGIPNVSAHSLRILRNDVLLDSLISLPFITIEFAPNYLSYYMEYFFSDSSSDREMFFDFPMSAGFHKVRAVEDVPSSQGGRPGIRLYIDEDSTKDEKRSLQYFLSRIPKLTEYLAGHSRHAISNIQHPWITRASVTGTGFLLSGPGNSLQSLFQKGVFGKDIRKSTVIFEISSHRPGTTTKKRLPMAFSFKVPYDPLLKAYIIYSTYACFVQVPLLIHQSLYRIAIRSNEKEGTIQYLWTFSDDSYATVDDAQAVMKTAAEKFREFLRAIIGELPSTPTAITINPLLLKNEKAVVGFEIPELMFDDPLSAFIDTTVDIDLSGLDRRALPERKCNSEMDASIVEAGVEEMPFPKSENSGPIAAIVESNISEYSATCLEITENSPTMESEPFISVAKRDEIGDLNSVLNGQKYTLYAPVNDLGYSLMGHYDVLEYLNQYYMPH